MPEGHTIHRVARDHRRWLRGQPVSCESPQGRFRSGAARLDGQILQVVEAHGKHLFYHFEDDDILHVHLGLYGRFRTRPLPLPPPQGAVRLRVRAKSHGFDLNGPNTCELVDNIRMGAIRSRLGEDPLRGDAVPDVVWRRISKSRAPLGRLLLDQSVIAGVGNIFRSEVLYAASVHPEREGLHLDRAEFDHIWQLLRDWMTIGVKYNRIITADPAQFGKTAGRLRREERLRVYKRPHCLECGTEIQQWELASRMIYACETCQS
jgi:endonuclease-8